MKKLILIIICLCPANVFCEDVPEEFSLPEATVIVGLPALGVTTAIFAYEFDYTFSESFDNFKRGFTSPPVWDNNPWYVNYIGHPEAGAESYLLARNRGHSILGSFAYSSLMSVTWEYGIESWIGARPSIQDLIFTSTLGSLFGELRYRAKKSLINNDDMLSKVTVVILDPIDACVKLLE
jgi:hypothetical protein